MKVLLLLILFPIRLFSQDIAGLWTGTLYNDSTGQTIQYEVAITGAKDNYSGFSSTTFIINGKEAIGIKSFKIVKRQDHFFFEDVDLLYNNYPSPPPKGVRQISSVTFTDSGNIKQLSGKFITSRTRQYGKQVTGLVNLTLQKNVKNDSLLAALKNLGLQDKLSFVTPPADIPNAAVNRPRDIVPPVKKVQVAPAPSVTDPLRELAKRTIETIETVIFTSDSLRLILYDNGYVDGDSVSLIINGKVEMSHQRLSQQAITKTIAGNADSIKIIMYAENLGSIAPNTGLLIIYDGQERHEIRFEGDLQKNAAILLKRKRN